MSKDLKQALVTWRKQRDMASKADDAQMVGHKLWESANESAHHVCQILWDETTFFGEVKRNER